MNQRAAFLFQILEKIGAPLMAAASAVQSEGESRPEAAVVAELLARAVQSGVELSNIMDIKESGAEGEAVRLALAGLASQLLAGQYRQKGRIPGEGETARLIAALSATLTFADNFSPAAGNTRRLAALEAGMPPADDVQVMMQCLHAFDPVVLAISEYSFGVPERKLVQEVTERLVATAGGIAHRLLTDETLSDRKQAELVLLRALAPLYCEAHCAETKRLAGLADSEREQLAHGAAALPMEGVWQVFERRAAMMELFAQTLLPRFRAGQTQDEVAIDPLPPMAAAAPPVEAEAPVQTSYNPMAFFRPGAQPAEEGENT
ncbi:MAG: hypothetical protein HYS17_01185 [Micavibrio aeruginosavorus]|uniref:Uncharacterized protein n=1 Tax=Micavibrio aeruginosavorus TaxID=349221 RepID=A0A7T5R2T9_9BACT|nr:MAG: hypothetical protein HYS17_01185 [Micavibrio aeruginosavorus]